MSTDAHGDPQASTPAYWDEAARAWTSWESSILLFLAPITARMQRDLALVPGERLLDVGCGTGEPVLSLAPRVSPAPVFAMDVSAAMLHAARQRNRAASSPANIHWICASGEKLPFRRGCFGAISARLCVMLFDDPAAGLTALREVLRPGGRISVAVWGPAEVNPVFGIPVRAFQEAGEPHRPDADRPGPLRLSREGELEAVLRKAGFPNISVADVECHQAAPSIPAYLAMLQEVSPQFRKRYAALDAQKQAVVRAYLEKELQRYAGPSGVLVPARARVALARS